MKPSRLESIATDIGIFLAALFVLLVLPGWLS
jgi:hypothetical protein